MKKRMNNRAQDLSIGTLILIVLGIVVLVLLILGFSIGWSNLWEKIGIINTSSINDVVTACTLAATSNDNFAYFQDFKEISINGNTEYLNCQDSRVQASLTEKLNNPPTGYENAEESAMKYCLEIEDTITETTKINGFDCEPTEG